jgi:SAM-dependent methyltransferase
MNQLDLVRRASSPKPWAEGDNIPWNEPEFSRRMLREHLSQEHDAASRRAEVIEQQVSWIHSELLSGQASKILDLACGPGLYSSRLARLGHKCIGIDYSPASIEYAVNHATQENLDCTYIEGDIRNTGFGYEFDIVMLIFGEFNVFRPEDAKQLLMKANRSLKTGGQLLLEVHPIDWIRSTGEKSPSWYSSESGLFSDKPHICLTEAFWDENSGTATRRYFIIDASTGEVSRYAQTFQAYDIAGYRAILNESGFYGVRTYPALTGDDNFKTEGLFVLAALKADRT